MGVKVMMESCIFCKIAKGDIPSHKVYEDDKYIALLDINPNTEGMTLVMPKKHFDSYVVDMPDKDYSEFMLIVKKVAKQLDKNLDMNRTAMVFEGMGVNHVHAKLYPLHGVGKEWKEIWSGDKRFFERYEGYVSTVLGPRMDDAKLADIAARIRGDKVKK
jgi:diadenosine tetraphosphate (Ap4A) HIT family hydrolase